MDKYILFNSNRYNEWSIFFFNYIKKYNINNKFLSINRNINENTVISNLDFKWNLVNLCKNPSISFNFLENIIKKDKIDYSESDLYCYYNNICKNPTYTIKNVLNEEFNKNNIYTYSLNPSIKWIEIINNKDFKWNFRYLSRNRNISFQNILDNSNYDWHYSELIKNPIFNIKDLFKLPKLKKYLNDYYENPNFDLIEYSQIIPINNYLEINRSIYRNENFNFKMINDLKILFPEFEIEYDLLGNKKNIDFDFILSNNYDWDIDYLSQNPNLTFDIIDKYNWNFSYMSFNTFDKQRELYVENH